MTVISTNLFYRPVLFLLAFLYSALTSWVNGFITAKVMKYFGATDWLFAAISAAVVFPALTYAILLAVDCVEYSMKSAARTPPLTIFILGLLWICISVPICFNGAYTAFKQERPKSSIQVNQMRRRIPEQQWYLKRRVILPIFGAIIFGSIFGEFQYVMKSVWRSYMYAMYGFLFVNVQLLTLIVSLLSIL